MPRSLKGPRPKAANLKFIRSVMGHSDISTTMDIYAEATEEKKQEIIGNLNGKIILRWKEESMTRKNHLRQ